MLFFIYFMLSNVIFVNAKEETRSFDNDIYSIPDELIQFFFEEKDMFDPEKNIIVAADILAELYEKYGDDNPYVIMYYAGEKKALSEYKNSGKSSDLANKILNLSEKYERIHNK